MDVSPGWDYPLVMKVNLWTGLASAVLGWWAQLGWYPRLRSVPASGFRAAHDRHLRKLGWLAPPVLLADLAASIWLAVNIWFWMNRLEWHSLRHFALFATSAIAATGIGWASTFLLQVPLHRRLELDRDAPALDALLSTNRLRVAAWSAKAGILAVWLALPGA